MSSTIPANEIWHVYVIAEDGAVDGPCKVGTARNVSYRLAGLQNGNWRRLVVLASFPVRGRAVALRIESQVHSQFAADRMGRRDWFECAPSKMVRFVQGLAE